MVYNNPFNEKLENETTIGHQNFLDFLQPSFAAIDSKEDIATVMARTHIILITSNVVHWRVANTYKDPMYFLAWPKDESRNLFDPDQVPIFQNYNADPSRHELPPRFHEDYVRSQEAIRRLIFEEDYHLGQH